MLNNAHPQNQSKTPNNEHLYIICSQFILFLNTLCPYFNFIVNAYKTTTGYKTATHKIAKANLKKPIPNI